MAEMPRPYRQHVHMTDGLEFRNTWVFESWISISRKLVADVFSVRRREILFVYFPILAAEKMSGASFVLDRE